MNEMHTVTLVWRHKEKRYSHLVRVSRVPVVGEEHLLMDYWYKKTNNTSTGTFKRVTAVRWQPPYATCVLNEPTLMYAYVFLHYSESYEPSNCTL